MEKLCSKQNQFGQISEATLAKVSAKDLWDMVFPETNSSEPIYDYALNWVSFPGSNGLLTNNTCVKYKLDWELCIYAYMIQVKSQIAQACSSVEAGLMTVLGWVVLC